MDFQAGGVVLVAGFEGEDLALVVEDDYALGDGGGGDWVDLVGGDFSHVGRMVCSRQRKGVGVKSVRLFLRQWASTP